MHFVIAPESIWEHTNLSLIMQQSVNVISTCCTGCKTFSSFVLLMCTGILFPLYAMVLCDATIHAVAASVPDSAMTWYVRVTLSRQDCVCRVMQL